MSAAASSICALHSPARCLTPSLIAPAALDYPHISFHLRLDEDNSKCCKVSHVQARQGELRTPIQIADPSLIHSTWPTPVRLPPASLAFRIFQGLVKDNPSQIFSYQAGLGTSTSASKGSMKRGLSAALDMGRFSGRGT